MTVENQEAEGPRPIVIDDFRNLAACADAISWKPFRDGVELHQIYGPMGQPGPSAWKRRATSSPGPFIWWEAMSCRWRR